MTFVSNDPSWWPTISYFRESSYFQVASLIVLLYDWALILGQEFELVWRQHWSLMTVLYLGVRYIGILFTIMMMFASLPSVSLTDAGCTISVSIINWTSVIVNVMLCLIMIARLYAMYQRSRKIRVFLIVIFLTTQIACVVMYAIIQSRDVAGEEYIISGTHMCSSNYGGDILFLIRMTWILATAWEILALCLAVCIAVKHFREQASTRGAVKDCFTVLMETHVFYFASFVAVTCLQFTYLSPNIADSTSVGSEIFSDVLSISQVVQLFVLGPRLILGLREYHAKLVANSDEGTAMTSIVFQRRIDISTGDGV